MASLALPAWTHPRHPIVAGERRHWQRSRVWRTMRGVLWAGLLFFLAVPLACPLLINLAAPGYNDLTEAVLINGGTLTLGLAVVSSVAGGLNALLAGLLGATLISRERECQSWPFLRLTTLTSLEIVGGKLAALFHTLTRPLLFVLGLRALTLLAGLGTALLAAIASRLTLADVAALWTNLAREMGGADGLAFQLSSLASVPVALGFWFLEPFFSVLYAAAVGLAASTVARSRGASIVLSVGVHLGLGLALYGPAQQLMSLGLVLLVPNAPALAFGLLPLFSFSLPVVAQTGLQAAVLVMALLFAYHRTQRLSE